MWPVIRVRTKSELCTPSPWRVVRNVEPSGRSSRKWEEKFGWPSGVVPFAFRMAHFAFVPSQWRTTSPSSPVTGTQNSGLRRATAARVEALRRSSRRAGRIHPRRGARAGESRVAYGRARAVFCAGARRARSHLGGARLEATLACRRFNLGEQARQRETRALRRCWRQNATLQPEGCVRFSDGQQMQVLPSGCTRPCARSLHTSPRPARGACGAGERVWRPCASRNFVDLRLAGPVRRPISDAQPAFRVHTPVHTISPHIAPAGPGGVWSGGARVAPVCVAKV